MVNLLQLDHPPLKKGVTIPFQFFVSYLHAPKIRENQDARVQVLSCKESRLDMQSDPAQCKIFFDERPAPATPLKQIEASNLNGVQM